MQIWKFEIPVHDFLVQMPKGAEILSAGVQGEQIMVWVRVNPDAKHVVRRLPIYGTGHEIEFRDSDLPLIDTVFMGPLVFHVFDGGEPS